MPSDEQIKTELVNRLSRDPRVDASNVLIEVSEGQVTLIGSVSTYRARIAAVEQAEDTRGVIAVEDRTTVAYTPGVRLPEDSATKANAENVLSWNADIDVSGLQVSVLSGVLTLRGSVRSYWERDRAQEVVSHLKGLNDVKNEITVVPAEKVSDELIAQNIIAALEQDVVLDASKVTVKVCDGVVTLTGKAPGYSARWQAYNKAANTVGVVAVENRIDIAAF
jgi:osmotically-inducible protein OsmY